MNMNSMELGVVTTLTFADDLDLDRIWDAGYNCARAGVWLFDYFVFLFGFGFLGSGLLEACCNR